MSATGPASASYGTGHIKGWNPDTFIQLTEYREVEEVLKRGRDFILEGTKSESQEFVGGTLIAIDGREHMARRRALMKMIGPKQPWGAEGHLFDDVFAETLEQFKSDSARGDTVQFDLLDFARIVNWRVTAALVGVDGVDDVRSVARFQELVVPVLHGLTVEYSRSEDDRQATVEAARKARETFREELFDPAFNRRQALVAEAGDAKDKKDALPGDMLTSLIVAAENSKPDTEHIFREMMALLAGAINNPVAQAAFALDDMIPWLEKHPEDYEHIGKKEFLNKAVKETLRLHRATRPYLVRIAARDVVLESTGRKIAEGDWVAGWIGRAGHDATVYGDDALEYDPYRVPVDGEAQPFALSFGAGPHVCIGRPMLLWEQGDEEAQGSLTKMLRKLLALRVHPDPDGEQVMEVGPEGGRRWTRYDVIMPR
ncbi:MULTISPECIES: cytochrome P450 [Actinomycetes]|uniref:cytochrome P450 n=1 Tax=Actinomycetes TaxID=1760 RepID=UPI0012DE6808|nr:MULTISPECIES: cytochrome P450 [Actinomycetes]